LTRPKTLLAALAASAFVMPIAQEAGAAEITLFRFFGDCANEYANVNNVDEATGECGIIQALTNQFNAENEIGATVVTQTADWGTYYDLLSATYAAGNIPDVAVMHGTVLPNFAARGLVEPIGEDLAAAGVDVEDFAPAARQAVTVEDQIYALPFDLHALILHLNMDLMAQAGLVDDQGNPILPSSPEEWIEHGRQVKEATGKHYSVIESYGGAVMNVRLMNSLLWQQGSDVVGDDGRTALLDTPEAMAAAEFVQSLYEEGFAIEGQDYASSQQTFLAGDAAMEINGTWEVDSYNAQAQSGEIGLKNYRAVSFPTLFGEGAIWGDSHMWTIPTDENRPAEEREAAIAFLKFLDEHNIDWARTGHLPVHQSVLESEEFKALPHRATYGETSDVVRNLPGVQNQRGIQDVMVSELTSMWLTDRTPEDVLGAMQPRVAQVLRRGSRN